MPAVEPEKKFRVINLSDRVIDLPKVVNGSLKEREYVSLAAKIDNEAAEGEEKHPEIANNFVDMVASDLEVLKKWGSNGKNPGLLSNWTAGKKPLLQVKEL